MAMDTAGTVVCSTTASSTGKPNLYRFKPSSKIFLLTFLRRCFFCGSFMYFCLALLCFHACLLVDALIVLICWEMADLLALVCDVYL